MNLRFTWSKKLTQLLCLFSRCFAPRCSQVQLPGRTWTREIWWWHGPPWSWPWATPSNCDRWMSAPVAPAGSLWMWPPKSWAAPAIALISIVPVVWWTASWANLWSEFFRGRVCFFFFFFGCPRPTTCNVNVFLCVYKIYMRISFWVNLGNCR